MSNLTSLDYMKLMARLAYSKHGVILSKTQLQKLLFIFYGVSLAKDKKPFSDDTPKAWPYGPVFPRVYKRYRETIPTELLESEKSAFMQDLDLLKSAVNVVDNYVHHSAYTLSDWSHRPGSPWSETIAEASTWNAEIDENLIIKFFRDDKKWQMGL